jgi:hydroxyacid-oxoacid transhydrogenase
MFQAGPLCRSTSVPHVPPTLSIAVSYHLAHRNARLISPAAYQGSNPISDIFSKWALETTIKYLPRISKDAQGDTEARAQML